MFRLYAQKREGSYEKITEKKEVKDILKIANKLKAVEYYSYLIIGNDGEGDYIYTREVLSEPVKIEFVDKDPSSVDVKTKVFKMSKAKEKQKFRKEIEDYLDR